MTITNTEAVSEIEGLIDAYWGLAFTEGREGRATDIPEGAAQETRSAISRRLLELSRRAANSAGGVRVKALPKYTRLDATGDRAYVEHPAGGVVHWHEYKQLLDHLLPYKTELLKIAEQVGESDDPFAAWESISSLAAEAEPVAVTAAIIAHVQGYDTPTESDPRRRYTQAQLETAIRLAFSSPVSAEVTEAEVTEAEVERIARYMCRAAITKPAAVMYSPEGVEYHVNKRWPEYVDHVRTALAALNGKE